jgi:hypothetical protein
MYTDHNPLFEQPRAGQQSADVSPKHIQLALFGFGILLMLLTGSDLYVCASIGIVILLFVVTMYRSLRKEEKIISKMEDKVD